VTSGQNSDQGSSQYQIEQMLAPDEQMWLDFGKLIYDQAQT
jgi:hypothetical protein